MNWFGGGVFPPPISFFHYIFLICKTIKFIYTKRGRIHHEEKTK